MSARHYIVLSLLGLGLAILVSRFQPYPGYMDADYYFSGGIQLFEGRGFTEPYVWNYLGDPGSLPQPSHSYWMPLASVVAAVGMWVCGTSAYGASRVSFILLAGAVPPLTARLAFSFSRQPFPALLSGLLGVFSIYYAPFLPVPDNYGIYIVLGSLFLLTLSHRAPAASLGLGAIAGFMTLARSDGTLWLIAAAVLAVLRPVAEKGDRSTARLAHGGRSTRTVARLALVAAGFAVVVTPWLVRNMRVYGAPRSPGSERLLWLTTYDDIFSFPADSLTPQRWWSQGGQAILAARLAALRWNMLNAFAAQGGVFLAPFIVLGVWDRRRDRRVQVGVGCWMALLGLMTLVLPAVGSRGGWFHAGAGLQSLWWSLAPLGLLRAVDAARSRGFFDANAHVVFGIAMAGIAAVMTAVILWLRVWNGWGEGEDQYPGLEARLVAAGAAPDDIVMVRNPPGYYAMTRRPAIVVPYGDATGIEGAADLFGARYLIIEPTGAAGPIRDVYNNLESPNFVFLGEEQGVRLFEIAR